MRGKLLLAAALAVVVAVVGIASAATFNTQKLDAVVAPSKVPKDRLAGVSINVTATAGAQAGHNISPANRARIYFDDDLKVDTKGLARCARSSIEGKSTEEAKAACSASKIGAGTSTAYVGGNTSTPPVTAVVTAFNGKPMRGHPVVLLHAYVAGPPAMTIVLAGELKPASGDFGMVLDVPVPILPLGTAIAKFQTKAQKNFRYRGRTHHYVNARCFDRNRTWNFKGVFNYEDGGSLTATDTQKCTVRR
jgi:hypothetical protein